MKHNHVHVIEEHCVTYKSVLTVVDHLQLFMRLREELESGTRDANMLDMLIDSCKRIIEERQTILAEANKEMVDKSRMN